MLPMSMEQMQEVVDTMRTAWEAAATVHPAISCLFEVGAPYLTIWDGNLCCCKHGQILKNVYNVPGHRRVAQAFLCIMPGEIDETGIDIVNAHAPSGDPSLTDPQRYQLMRNLLQSKSMARANKCIGEGMFLVGGDLNTDGIILSQILNKLRDRGVLNVSAEVLFPSWGKHGDMCVVGGFTAAVLGVKAHNHDPQHEPYGIAWSRQRQHVSEQLATTPRTQIPPAPETKNESRASGSIWEQTPPGETTASHQAGKQQKCRWRPKQPPPSDTAITSVTGEQPQSDPSVKTGHLDRHPSQLPPEKAPAPAWPATEQPHGPVENEMVSPEKPLSQLPLWSEEDYWRDEPVETSTPADSGTDTRAVGFHSPSDAYEPPTPKELIQMKADTPKTNKGQHSDDRDTGTTRPATEQPRSDENEPPMLNGPAQELAYGIVNAFMDNLTFECAAAERLIKRIILDADNWTPDMLLNIDEVFRPIFFHYPNGLHDRTRAEPRDASQYIRQWRDIAEWRERVHGWCPAGTRLTEPQVQSIFQQYIDDFILNEADNKQRQDSRGKNKSRSEVRLRRLCGSGHMARAIWEVGLPDVQYPILVTLQTEKLLTVLVPATEQVLSLEQDVQDAIAAATFTILTWLSSLATAIQSHKETPEYQEHARKSGTQKDQSGLTATEREAKEEKKRAARMKYGHWTRPQWH